MKHLRTIVLCLTLALPTLTIAQASDAHLADELYRQADYPAAIEAYENLLADGWESADLHYNLGNAYYRNGQNAKAILNYERALRLRPSMHDAKENLALANSHTADRITPLPQLFLVRWYNALLTHTSPLFWRILWLCLLALLGAAVVGFRLGGSATFRKTTFLAGIIIILLWAAASVLLFASTAHSRTHNDAIVMEPAVAVKSSPEQQSTDKLILHDGTKVSLLDELTGWSKIRLADGTTGWCPTESIERI